MNPERGKKSWLVRPNVCLIGWWIILSWVFCWTCARAAEQPMPAPQVSETKQAVPVAIPAAEIAPRAQQALTRLQEMRSQIRADNTVKAVQEALLTFIERSDRWWESRARTIAQTRSVQEVNSALSEWATGQAQIDQWENDIAGKWEELAVAQREVEQILVTWKETQAAGKNLPKAVLQKVAEVLKEANDSDKLIREQNDRALETAKSGIGKAKGISRYSQAWRQRRIQISVGIAYGTDPGRVIDILVDIARKHPEVLSQPAPMAVFDRFGDSALAFTLLCWTGLEEFFRVRSELTIAVNNAFKEAGIQIPFPQRDLHFYGPDRDGVGSAPSEEAKDGVPANSETREMSSPNPERFAKK
jgi:Mechanosensitive ion channel